MNHRFRNFYASEYTRCDCGNPEFMKVKTLCSNHGLDKVKFGIIQNQD